MAETLPTLPDEARGSVDSLVWHWYELICPFCYVGQDRTRLLEELSLRVVEIGFEIHPETPATGRYVGPRRGAMYENLEREAELAGLPLRWPDRIANSRCALSAVEWARRAAPDQAPALRAGLFRAHFALGEDIADEATVLRHAAEARIAIDRLVEALADGSADELLRCGERAGRLLGVRATPTWRVKGRLVQGLLPRDEMARLARAQPPPAAP